MARRTVTVEVTQADIDKATKNSSSRCVVATALARAFPDAHHVEVDLQTLRMTRGDERAAWPTPWQVQQYIVDFDAGIEIQPFTFRLDMERRMIIKRRVRDDEAKANAAENDRRRRKPSATKEKPLPVKTKQVGAPGAVKAPPRTFKTKGRHYGMRGLRINQHREAEGTVEQPFSLLEE